MPNGTQRFKDLMELGMDAVKNEEVDLIDEMCNKFIVTVGYPVFQSEANLAGEAERIIFRDRLVIKRQRKMDEL